MSDHEARLGSIRQAFASANDEIVATVGGLDDDAAMKAPPAAWNSAQIGWHVARTTEFLAAAISGEIPEVLVPRTPDFEERLASLDLSGKIRALSILEPPQEVTREAAVGKLLDSIEVFENALGRLTPERNAAECVKLSFGVLSLYETGEFAVAHIHRHLGQIRRTLEG